MGTMRHNAGLSQTASGEADEDKKRKRKVENEAA